MNEDRGWELYQSDADAGRAYRDRIDWLVRRARGRVLDVGCSQGVLSIVLARAGREVVGVDIEERAVASAADRLDAEPDAVRERVRLLVHDAATWAPGERFDTVVLGEVLDELARPGEMIDAVADLVADGGQLLMTGPLGWLEHHHHRDAFGPSEVVRLLERQFGIHELEISGGAIRVAAQRGAASDASAVDPGRLLAEIERALVDAQRSGAALTRRQREHRDHIETLTRDVEDAERRLAAADSRLDDYRERVEELSAKRKRLHESGTYRLGALLVGVGRRPTSALALPVRLGALAYRELSRRQAGGRAPRRPLVRHVYEGRFRVEVPGARALDQPDARRILHVLEYSLPHQQNGYTLRSAHIVSAQRALGWDPVVVTKPRFPDGESAGGRELHAGVPHHRLPGRALPEKPNLVEYLRAYVTEAAGVLEQVSPGIVHAASNFRNAYAAMELARNYRLPFVYEVRGLWEETRVANRRLARHDAKYRKLVGVETHCMRAADAVVTLGESLAGELARRGVPEDKIFLVPNAVDCDAVELRPPRADLRDALGLAGKLVVGYIGSVTPLERLDVLLEAIALLARGRRDPGAPEVAGLIVGAGAATEELERRARQLGVADRVHLVGRVPHAEVADYYALIDVIVCTRGRERVCELVTPLKPYEAMAYRKPVVVSDIPALREMVIDGETGRVVPPEQPAALARAIGELAEPEHRAAVSERAHAWVREHRSWQRVAARYRDAYDRARRAFAERAG